MCLCFNADSKTLRFCSIPKLENFLSHKAKLIIEKKTYNWNGLTFLNKDLQFLEGLEESFRGNSRIISDCRACSLKTLSGCLYASRKFLKFVYLCWRSMWIVQPYLPSCNLQPLSRVNSSEERIHVVSFTRTKANHDKLPRLNNSLITRHKITLYIICINSQVVFFENNFREFGTLNAVCE